MWTAYISLLLYALSAWIYVVPSIDSTAQGKDIDFLETFPLFQEHLPNDEQIQELEERAGGTTPITPTEMEVSPDDATKPEKVEANDASSEPTGDIPAQEPKPASSNQRGAHAKDGSPAFKQTMSVEKVMDTIGQFTNSQNLAQVTTLVVGTNSSHQRKGAMTEVALTKREQRRQHFEESKENKIEQPADWDSGANLPADVQCPPKKKGRKPKDKSDTSKPTSRKRKTAEKEDKSETAAPKKRPKRNQTQETKEPESKETDETAAHQRKAKRKAKAAAMKKPASAKAAKPDPESKAAGENPSSGSGLSAQEKVERERETKQRQRRRKQCLVSQQLTTERSRKPRMMALTQINAKRLRRKYLVL